MSKSQTLRVLVNARLTAAAEEIFALFERMIAEYEEELCRSEKENQRKQRLLDEALNPRVLMPRAGAGVRIPSPSPPGLNQEITETPQIKEEPEEQSVKQEEEQLPVFVPESSAACVKTDESSLLQQRHTEHREETQEEDISSEPHFHSGTVGLIDHLAETSNDDDWKYLVSCPNVQMETAADGDHYNQLQTIDRSSAAQNSSLSPEYKCLPGTSATVNNGDMSGIDEGAERKKYQCSVCQKRFRTNQHLQTHIGIHTGERPYSCSICEKTFYQKVSLDYHIRLHTGEKLYRCSICVKTFNRKCNLKMHMKTHTNEKPFSCPFCEKTFARKDYLDKHKRIHTGEKPYSCSICNKGYTEGSSLNYHMKTHTTEKPYSCSLCNIKFTLSSHLNTHMRTHTKRC